jgi:hypothetical protein
MVILRTLAVDNLWHTLSTSVASAKKLGCGLLLCHVTICQLASWTLHCFDAVKATRFAALLQAYLVELVEASQRYCGRPAAVQWLAANSTSHRWQRLYHNPFNCKKQTLGPKHFTEGWDTHHTDMSGHCNYLKIYTMKTIVV